MLFPVVIFDRQRPRLGDVLSQVQNQPKISEKSGEKAGENDPQSYNQRQSA